ncbi:hypothetical protein Rhopal_007670-T1 [Rhodotorula paludigena]|uniref:TFIIS N-terminal domain-containing protein n=1 Tax=Rhodotorula paludigena TaxID=86838 RepID=A0AAV5GYZ9_9BASI|nr:hypothetical protein Rhopal_007670-T1 [Rhodotorula paludigena]
MSDTEDRPQESLGAGDEQHAGDGDAAPAARPAFDDDIFGGDSDLSDLEESDNDEPAARRSASPARSASPLRSPSPAGPSDDDGDEYRTEAVRKMPKIGKKKRVTEDGDEAEPQPKKRKTKSKKKAREPEPEEEEELDPEVRRRKELAKRITAAAKKPTGKGKRRKQQDDEDLDMINDEAVAHLRREMLQAADRDVEENELGRPALHKLRLLPKVVDLMQKTALHDSIAENGMFEAVKRWLEPLPDKSLPALNIQRALFTLLRTMPVETSALKASELGKVTYFYTRAKRVDPSIARLASQLVGDWMRPILRRSKAFVDRDLDAGSGAGAAYGGTSHAAAAALGRGAGSANAPATRRAAIPSAMVSTFTVAPRSATGGAAERLPGQGGGARLRQYKSKLQAVQQAARKG